MTHLPPSLLRLAQAPADTRSGFSLIRRLRRFQRSWLAPSRSPPPMRRRSLLCCPRGGNLRASTTPFPRWATSPQPSSRTRALRTGSRPSHSCPSTPRTRSWPTSSGTWRTRGWFSRGFSTARRSSSKAPRRASTLGSCCRRGLPGRAPTPTCPRTSCCVGSPQRWETRCSTASTAPGFQGGSWL